MNFNDYQEEVKGLRIGSAKSSLYAITGIAGEVGELHSLFAKSIRDGVKDDMEERMMKECGDILWFVAAIATDLGYTLQEVADTNIIKLKDRKARNVLQGSGDDR